MRVYLFQLIIYFFPNGGMFLQFLHNLPVKNPGKHYNTHHHVISINNKQSQEIPTNPDNLNKSKQISRNHKKFKHNQAIQRNKKNTRAYLTITRLSSKYKQI